MTGVVSSESLTIRPDAIYRHRQKIVLARARLAPCEQYDGSSNMARTILELRRACRRSVSTSRGKANLWFIGTVAVAVFSGLLLHEGATTPHPLLSVLLSLSTSMLVVGLVEFLAKLRVLVTSDKRYWVISAKRRRAAGPPTIPVTCAKRAVQLQFPG
jgi:hypothetical protein